jgi:hypothetical protein
MPPSAAHALYPHLRQGTPNEVEQRRKPNVADALFPSLSREAKARDADQRLWDEICERLRRGLREARRR